MKSYHSHAMRNNTLLGATAVLPASEYVWFDFPIPGHTGELEAAFLNRDVANGPIVAALKMGPGAVVPAHYHERTTEMFWVMEGDFENKGTTYGPGTVFTVQPGDVYGPHTTVNGCTLYFAQSVEVDPSDFFLAD
jgi:mannose-6-phosphate isomerase-like protein (cupin superfamily)